MTRQECKPIIDALIFAADAPLSLQKIRQIIEDVSRQQLSAKDVREIIEELKKDNRDQQRGFFLQEVAGGYQYRTRPHYAQWIKKIKRTKSMRLTQSTMETLAIIAYKQPIIRAEIEKIRGVDSGGIIKNLLERNLIKIVGRKNIPGRPFMFGTARKFLETFGLENLSDLPTLKEIDQLDDSQLPSVLRNKLTESVTDVSAAEEIVAQEQAAEDTRNEMTHGTKQHSGDEECVEPESAAGGNSSIDDARET